MMTSIILSEISFFSILTSLLFVSRYPFKAIPSKQYPFSAFCMYQGKPFALGLAHKRCSYAMKKTIRRWSDGISYD